MQVLWLETGRGGRGKEMVGRAARCVNLGWKGRLTWLWWRQQEGEAPVDEKGPSE